METANASIELTKSEALCLEAIRAGFTGQTAIALQAKIDLKAVARALEHLSRRELVRRQRRTEWRITRRGQICAIQVVPDRPRARRGRKPGGIVAGSAGERLLKLLDRPRRGEEVLTHLAISRQRLHQLVVKLYAEGRLRFADPGFMLHLLARADDRSLLLTRAEERLLSAMAEGVATTIPRLAATTGMDGRRTSAVVSSLVEKELIVACGERRSRALYRLTTEGRDHFQRRAVARVQRAGAAGGQVRSCPRRARVSRGPPATENARPRREGRRSAPEHERADAVPETQRHGREDRRRAGGTLHAGAKGPGDLTGDGAPPRVLNVAAATALGARELSLWLSASLRLSDDHAAAMGIPSKLNAPARTISSRPRNSAILAPLSTSRSNTAPLGSPSNQALNTKE